MKKELLTIENMSYDGLGVAYLNDKCFLVEGALPKEEVECIIEDDSKKVVNGIIGKINKASEYRVEPICPYFGKCGGCNLQHLKYEESLNIKKELVNNTLRKIGHIDNTVSAIYGMENPYFYRNKLQFPVSYSKGRINIGYFRRKTHDVIDVDKCYLQSDNVTNLVKDLREILNKEHFSIYNEKTGNGILRHIEVRENENNELMIIFVVNADKDKCYSLFTNIINTVTYKYHSIINITANINREKNNTILGRDAVTLYGIDNLRMTICDTKYDLSYNSFFQVNTREVEILYREVLKFADLEGSENVIDAYCGVGSISLLLAKQAKHVFGIEVIKEAIDNANHNKEINNIKNASFICGKVEDEIDKLLNKDIDLIVFDPPRKGLDSSIIEMIKETKIKHIVYVSCNYATLARDLCLLKDYYEINDIECIDMFPQTTECEVLSKLTLKK